MLVNKTQIVFACLSSVKREHMKETIEILYIDNIVKDKNTKLLSIETRTKRMLEQNFSLNQLPVSKRHEELILCKFSKGKKEALPILIFFKINLISSLAYGDNSTFSPSHNTSKVMTSPFICRF